MRVIFCGYRCWALNIIDEIKKHKKINSCEVISSKEEYDFKFNKLVINADLIVFLGWSWIIPKEITNKYLCVGVHPSDLPDYRGGSPIQHQIINGIIQTKISLMTISEKLDGGDIWLKQDLDLGGDTIEIIFKNLEESSIALFNIFFDFYPNINPIKQDLTKGSYFKRRRLDESRIKIEDFKNKPLKEIYNIIRCLTDPYPNAYFEDSDGNRLYFKEVKYMPKLKL
ncbi:formyltransferase family protein [Flavobacteriaceae bacterium]|nr:formyltransferase family protein [Flavobacteriaceae bacterium]